MKLKRILYYLPIIILIVYLIIYIPLFKYITDIYASKEIMPAKVNDVMFIINILVICFTSIMKIFFRGSKCEIGKVVNAFGIIIFILLCIVVFLFGGVFTWS